MGESDGRDPDCDLCEAAPITPWHHEDEFCWIADCEACATPMVVWRTHGIEPAQDVERHMLAVLEGVAGDAYGEYWIDPDRRSIPGHWHVHARPKGRFYGHR
jgi:hypothetical protein